MLNITEGYAVVVCNEVCSIYPLVVCRWILSLTITHQPRKIIPMSEVAEIDKSKEPERAVLNFFSSMFSSYDLFFVNESTRCVWI